MAKVKNLLIMSTLAAAPPATGLWTLMTTFASGNAIAANSTSGLVIVSSSSGYYRSIDNGATWNGPVSGVTARSGDLVGSTFTFMGNSTKDIITTTDGVTFTTNSYTNPNAVFERFVGSPTFGIGHAQGFALAAKVTPPSTIQDVTTNASSGISPSSFTGVSTYSTSLGQYFFGGSGGAYMTTTDGTSYTRYTGNTAAWRSVVQTSSGRFVVCDSSEVIWYNDDPIGNPGGWIQAANVSAVTTTNWGEGNLMAASTDSDIIVLGARQVGADILLVSRDNGLTWNQTPDLNWTSTFVDAMVYAGNNYFVGILSDGQVWRGDFN